MCGRSISLIASLVLAIVGCSTDSRPPPRLPQLVDVGGPKLAHPKIVPIFYQNDVSARELTRFSQWMVTSTWLDTVGNEYGVGAGSVVGTVSMPDTAPTMIDDGAIIDLLFQGLADGTLPSPTPDTLYMLHVPSGTVVTVGNIKSCDDFFGYHSSARRGGVEIAYAVMTKCGGSLTVVEKVTSHELIEAATDPFPSHNPGFQLRDLSSPWLAMGEEVADLCQRGDDSDSVQDTVYVTQRSWSNAAAEAERDPCLPRTGNLYFNVVADLKSLPRIRPGGHEQVNLTGWSSSSDGATVSWGLTAVPAKQGDVTLTLGTNMLGTDKSTTLDIAVPASAAVGSSITMYVLSNVGAAYQFLPLHAVVGEPCSSFHDCASCTAHAGCGYCGESGRCEAEGAAGSAESSCAGASFATWPGSCSGFCAGHSGSCTDCASQPGCGWCGSSNACMEASHEYSHPQAGTCAYADWSFTPDYCPR